MMFKVLCAMVTATHAQDMLPAHVSVSSITALGPDGRMHTSLRKVVTQTSDDGLQRIEKVECRDGACGGERHVVGIFGAMTPSGLFAQMPDMPRLRVMAMPEMPHMHHVMHCMQQMHQSMMKHAHPVMTGMQQMHQRMMKHAHPVVIRIMPRQVHFLAPRMETAFDDKASEPEVPFGAVLAVAFVLSASATSLLFGSAVLGLALLWRCCANKAAARERPLRELGQPLAPEEQAELGAGPGCLPQAKAVWAAPMRLYGEQAYLMDVYQRAAQKSEQKVAQAVLREVYAAALARVQ